MCRDGGSRTSWRGISPALRTWGGSNTTSEKDLSGNSSFRKSITASGATVNVAPLLMSVGGRMRWSR